MNKKRPKKSPFGESKDLLLSADIEAGGGQYGFASYGIGYFRAGNLLCWSIFKAYSGWKEWNLDSEDAEFFIDAAIPDALFYPIVSMYRQGAELMCKHFIYDKPNPQEYDDDAKYHKLLGLWKKAKQELLVFFGPDYKLTEENKDLKIIDKFIQNLHELDPDGMQSRFPVNLVKKTRSFEKYDAGKIDIVSLFKSAVEAEESIMTFVEGRMEVWDDMAEVEYEMM